MQKSKLCVGCGVLLFLIGAACLVIGVFIQDYVDDRINDTVRDSLKITASDIDDADFAVSEGSKFYDYYFWNFTNAPEVLAGTEKPALNEIGPFRYNEKVTKFDIDLADEGKIVRYRKFSTMSVDTTTTVNGLLPTETPITNLNPVYLGFLAKVYQNFKVSAGKLLGVANDCSNVGGDMTAADFVAGGYESCATTSAIDPTRPGFGGRLLIPTAAGNALTVSESLLNSAVGTNVYQGVLDQFTSGDIIGLLPYITIGFFNGVLAANGVTNQAAAFQSATINLDAPTGFPDASWSLCTANPAFDNCWGIDNAEGAADAKTDTVLNHANVGILSSTGIFAWVAPIGGFGACAAANAATPANIPACYGASGVGSTLELFGITISNQLQVLQWWTALTQVSLYSTFVFGGYNGQCATVFAGTDADCSGADAIASFTDIGAHQFSHAMFTSFGSAVPALDAELNTRATEAAVDGFNWVGIEMNAYVYNMPSGYSVLTNFGDAESPTRLSIMSSVTWKQALRFLKLQAEIDDDTFKTEIVDWFHAVVNATTFSETAVVNEGTRAALRAQITTDVIYTLVNTVGWSTSIISPASVGNCVDNACISDMKNLTRSSKFDAFTASGASAGFYQFLIPTLGNFFESMCGITDTNYAIFAEYYGKYLPYHLFYTTQLFHPKELKFQRPGESEIIDVPVGPYQGGLITTRMASETLFGYDQDKPDVLLATLFCSQDDSADDVRTNCSPLAYGFGGLFSTYENQAEFEAAESQALYEIYTGKTDFKNVRTYYKWQGLNKFQNFWPDLWPLPDGGSRDDVTPHFHPKDCALFDEKFIDNNGDQSSPCSLWHSITYDGETYSGEEIIDKTNGADQVEPFGEDGMVDVSFAWTSDGWRTVRFLRSERWINVRGVRARRYYLDNKNVWNQESTTFKMEDVAGNPYFNAKYKHDGPNGTLPMFRTSSGNPVILTRPRYWQSEDIFSAVDLSIGGVPYSKLADEPADDADRDLVDIWIDIEPLSGATIQGYKALQMNMKVDETMLNNPHHRHFFDHIDHQENGVKTVYFPILWLVERGLIKSDDASDFTEGIYDNRDLADLLAIVGIGVGVFLTLTSIICIIYFWKKTPSDGDMTRLSSRPELA